MMIINVNPNAEKVDHRDFTIIRGVMNVSEILIQDLEALEHLNNLPEPEFEAQVQAYFDKYCGLHVSTPERNDIIDFFEEQVAMLYNLKKDEARNEKIKRIKELRAMADELEAELGA